MMWWHYFSQIAAVGMFKPFAPLNGSTGHYFLTLKWYRGLGNLITHALRVTKDIKKLTKSIKWQNTFLYNTLQHTQIGLKLISCSSIGIICAPVRTIDY